MKLFLTVLFGIMSFCCFSQDKGYVIATQDQRIEQLIQRQKDIHEKDGTIDGYRIQIFMESGNDAVELANQTMEEFKTKYPDVPIYLIFGQPYYRLRVGDFRTRLDAEKAFRTLSKDYKKAFIPSDRIQLPYNIFCESDFNVEEYEHFTNDSVNMDIFYYEE